MSLRRVPAALSLLVAGGLVVGCELDVSAPEQATTAQAATERCFVTRPMAMGTFIPSGNHAVDPMAEPPNPIVRVDANGGMLRLTAKNGETGIITLSDASAMGTFWDERGLAQVWVAPFVSGPSAGADTIYLSGSAGTRHPIRLYRARASAMFGGFGFANPFGGSSSYVTAVRAFGDRIQISDAWGATGTITLLGVDTCE